jgi:hypothetical protein
LSSVEGEITRDVLAPAAVILAETLCAIMGKSLGEYRLELVYRDGKFRHLYHHDERVEGDQLRQFDVVR